METSKLKKFAQFARRSLIDQVSAKLKLVLAEGSAGRRESAEAVKKLEEQKKKVIHEVKAKASLSFKVPVSLYNTAKLEELIRQLQILKAELS